MQKEVHSLFNNCQLAVFNAVKAFLSKAEEKELNKPVTTSLRLPKQVKIFYECLAETEETSINTAIVTTLKQVKDQTIEDYLKIQAKNQVGELLDYQLKSFLKIIDAHKIDYNDLSLLLEWATGKKVARSELVSKEKLLRLMNKEIYQKLCRLFGYSYEWLQNNNHFTPVSLGHSKNLWHTNPILFSKFLVEEFYSDETVESFYPTFLFYDKSIINSLFSGAQPNIPKEITLIIVADRYINGLVFSTYHQFESINVNSKKTKDCFMAFLDTITKLKGSRIIKSTKTHLVKSKQYEQISGGRLHPSKLLGREKDH